MKNTATFFISNLTNCSFGDFSTPLHNRVFHISASGNLGFLWWYEEVLRQAVVLRRLGLSLQLLSIWLCVIPHVVWNFVKKVWYHSERFAVWHNQKDIWPTRQKMLDLLHSICLYFKVDFFYKNTNFLQKIRFLTGF